MRKTKPYEYIFPADIAAQKKKEQKEMKKDQETKTFITEGLPRFDKAKNQLKADVLNHYGEAEGWKRWNQIDHLKPIYILDHFPELKAKLPTARINELQVISDELPLSEYDPSLHKEQS